MDPINARISRGEHALDTYDALNARHRQWFERFDRLDLFNMDHKGQRILDILFEDYVSGLEALGVSTTGGAEYGFAGDTSAESLRLTEGWKVRIYSRLEQKINALILPLGCKVVGFSALSVGNHGDARVYQPGVVIECPPLMSVEERGSIATDIINKVKGVTRVLTPLPIKT